MTQFEDVVEPIEVLPVVNVVKQVLDYIASYEEQNVINVLFHATVISQFRVLAHEGR